MKRPVRWLHITEALTDNGDRPRPSEELFLDIRKRVEIVAHSFVPDLLFVTGDASYSAAPEEFRRFSGLLQGLQDEIGHGIERRTFIVPGNHDVILRTHRGFDAGILLGRKAGFFAHGPAGRSERQMLLPRFQAFRDMKASAAGWLDSEGCGVQRVPLDGTTVGVVLTNTAWLSTGGDDAGRLTPGAMLVEAALESIHDTEYRFVLGHHPLEKLQPEESLIISELLRKHGAIYLHGAGLKTRHALRPVPSALTIAGLPLNGRELRRNVSGIVWGEVDAAVVRLRPEQFLIDSRQWIGGPPGYREDSKEEVVAGGGSWWPLSLPKPEPAVFQRPFHVPIYATRYTRRTRNDRVVFEHAQRAADKDIGDEELRRGPMLVDEAMAFFSHVLLLGPDGAGKSFSLNRLYEILVRAYESNDPLIIRENYPDWRHSPLPMPIRLHAPSVIEWLSAGGTAVSSQHELFCRCFIMPKRITRNAVLNPILPL